MAINDEFSMFEKAFPEKPAEVTPEPPTNLEPPKEQTEPPKTEPITPPAEPPKEEPKITEFFNKTFKTDFKTEDDIKVLIDSASKAKQLEEQLKSYEDLKAQVEEYKKGVDPLKYFRSETDYKVQQFLKAHPDKNPNSAIKLFNSELSELSDLEVVAQLDLLDGVVEGSEADAKAVVAEEYGIDLEADPKDWTPVAKARLKRAALEARKNLQSIKDGITLPEKVDVAGQVESQKAKLQQRKETISKGWNDVVPKLLTDLKEVEINDYDKDGNAESLIKYVMDEDAKKSLGSEVLNYLVTNDKDINDDNVKEAATIIQSQYVLRNLGKILKSYGGALVAELDRKRDEELHNPNPIKTDVRPVDDAEKERKAKETDYALGGHSFTYKKPF